MAASLEYFFDYSCPFAYLASTQIEMLAARMAAELVPRPILLGGIFRENGTPQRLFEAQVPAKAAYNLVDMARWAQLYGVPLRMPPGHPMRTVEALRATIAAGCDLKVIHGFFHAYWAEGKPVSEPAVLTDVLGRAGHDVAAILAKIGQQAAKDDLRRRTDEALALGIFGVPVFRVDGGPIFWGQDRMHFAAGIAWESLLPPVARRTRATQHEVEVYWDFSSPFSYLGFCQAEDLARRTGARLVHRPMLLGALFKQIGQPMVPLSTWSPSKQMYVAEDMKRWAASSSLPFKFPSRFPMSTVKPLRVYLALPESRRDAFARAVFNAYWAEDQDISDDAVLRNLVGDGADDAITRSQSQEIKQALVDSTARAALAGVFGAPSWVVDGQELFWGQDRVVLVERALMA